VIGLIGLYAVTAYAVAQRTREIGIRIALGAERSVVTRVFVAAGCRLAIAGVAVGVLVAIPATRALASLLFGVAPLDPLTFVAGPAGLVSASALASYLPAARAAAVNPLEVLRG